ncbi:MAG: YggS family pyridoxal phosphate-dependent enzyme [Opitutaceae bacterium]
MISYEEFSQRAERVRAEIGTAAKLAGREPSSVTLLAVTKTHPPTAAEYVYRYGLMGVGENRVQEAATKRPLVTTPLRWELIGHLQSNKAKLAAQYFDRVQSVDSEKLLAQLDRAAGELGKTLPILLQINAGNDPAKFGIEPDAAARLLEVALASKNLRVEGLMTIAPLGTNAAENAQLARFTFANLRAIRDRLATQFGTPLAELSMGMSSDLAIAIAEGSTLVRVGTALFGTREARVI